MLFLRTVDSNHRSYGGFQWPSDVGAVVTAPDWDPAPRCGGGLHGLLWGEGNGRLLSDDPESIWQVVESEESVDIGGKHKFRECTVRYIGDREGATTFMLNNGGAGKKCSFAKVTAGDFGIAIAGDFGESSAGKSGFAIVGEWGCAFAGDRGSATAGYGGTTTAGYGGTATTGDYGVAEVGDCGTATVGSGGTATAGAYGFATAGYNGIATTGSGGTAMTGPDGTATTGPFGKALASHGGRAAAGSGGTLIISFQDDAHRNRVAVGYVGEGGILPGVYYAVIGEVLTPVDSVS